MTTTNILQPSEDERISAAQDELTSEEMAKVNGGSPSLYEALCKGTHIPDVVVELW